MNEQQFRALCVPATCTIREALDTMERTAKGILLVLDSKGRLRRTLSDGDLRRAALAQTPDSAFIATLPGQPPFTIDEQEPVARALALMDQHLIDHVPVVDAQGMPVDIVLRRELSQRIWLSSPHLGEEETAFVEEAFRTNWIAPLGPHVDGFERELAAYAGVGHAAAGTGPDEPARDQPSAGAG